MSTLAVAHPLDPLTPHELAAAVAAVRADARVGEPLRFACVRLDEVAAAAGERRAEVVVRDAGARRGFMVSVLLGDPPVAERWEELGGRQPPITPHESRLAAQACREDPAFLAALARRGIEDASLVMIDAESIGGFVPERHAGRRIAWGATWHREDIADNGYARPVEGVVPIIDLDTLEVLEVEDHGVVPMATERGTFAPGEWGERAGLRAAGDRPARGRELRGRRLGGGLAGLGAARRVRPPRGPRAPRPALPWAAAVLARASVNEMYVPYLDPTPTQFRKNFFDWGEYGAGVMTNSLELGCDCLGEVHYFDGAVVDGDGEPCDDPQRDLHARGGRRRPLEAHRTGRTGEVEVRRSRRLVVSSFVDGRQLRLRLLLVALPGRLDRARGQAHRDPLDGRRDARGERPPHGRAVAPRRAGARPTSTTSPCGWTPTSTARATGSPRSTPRPSRDAALDPHGNAVRSVAHRCCAPSARRARLADPARGVHWRIESDTARNRYGEPTAYRLHADAIARPLARPGSVTGRRAPFTDHHVLATRRDPQQRYAGGEYPNQAEPGADGIHVWQDADRSLDPTELVVWANVGTHHLPRPEDWPVMPVAHAHLRLEPDGFFDRNPALDVPPPTHRC